jgi:hypothetical protein
MTERRYFTPDEANALLPDLRKRLERVREARLVLLRHAERVRSRAAGNGGGREGSEHWEAARDMRREIEVLAAAGVLLRDGERGLVDFPARRGDRDVFLCWQLGEDAVAHWHEVDGGFAGRRPL